MNGKSNSRPQWRYAHYVTEFFFEGSQYAGRCDHLRGARYYHSREGAEFAERLDYEHGGNSDYDRFSRVEQLQPDAWSGGMSYRPPAFHPQPIPADDFDDMPF